MRYITAFLLVQLFSGAFSAPATADKPVTLDTPPTSLEKWYKPANKRQVWLHTMFRLRREMQAISEYATLNDRVTMKKWIKRLKDDYTKIPEMVPEWEKEIKPRLLDELEMFAEKGDTHRIAKTLEMIERTCDDCHNNYQPLVTAIYRSPNYDDIRIESNNGTLISFEDNMEELSTSVNRILIALDDGQTSSALQASQTLTQQLKDLGASCNNCHQEDNYPHDRILGNATSEHLKTLQENISKGLVKDSQKLMGEIAVIVCARCHNTHRIVYDLRNALTPQ